MMWRWCSRMSEFQLTSWGPHPIQILMNCFFSFSNLLSITSRLPVSSIIFFIKSSMMSFYLLQLPQREKLASAEGCILLFRSVLFWWFCLQLTGQAFERFETRPPQNLFAAPWLLWSMFLCVQLPQIKQSIFWHLKTLFPLLFLKY